MRYDFEHLFFTFVLASTTFRKALEVSEGFFKKQLEQDREQNTAGPNQKKAHFSPSFRETQARNGSGFDTSWMKTKPRLCSQREA